MALNAAPGHFGVNNAILTGVLGKRQHQSNSIHPRCNNGAIALATFWLSFPAISFLIFFHGFRMEMAAQSIGREGQWRWQRHLAPPPLPPPPSTPFLEAGILRSRKGGREKESGVVSGVVGGAWTPKTNRKRPENGRRQQKNANDAVQLSMATEKTTALNWNPHKSRETNASY